MSSWRACEPGRRPGESEQRPGESGQHPGVRSCSPDQGQAEFSQTIGLPELEEIGATAAPPPSCEELGIEGNGKVCYDLGWGWMLEQCWTRAAIVGLIVEWVEWSSSPLLFIFFVLAAL
jgi:hypothetical protein